jgi:hypothetical protein
VIAYASLVVPVAAKVTAVEVVLVEIQYSQALTYLAALSQ